MLILQDLGFAALCRKMAPDLLRHASTQMSVQTSAGIELLKMLGFQRAVLPRELSKAEIAALREKTDMELEVFIHGAQCMSVSGQCYMSAMLGARSGNRGLCAQPCRLAFSAGEPGRFDLSLKDLSLIDRLQELQELGVDAFKIEGRMTRPEYVAAAVSAARNARAGTNDPALSDALEAVFSRSGFSSGYYDDLRGAAMFGVRRKEDVTAATGKLLSSLAHLYDKETPRVPVDFALTVHANEPPTLAASAGQKAVFVRGEALPEPARTTPLRADALRERLQKCGGTPFYAQTVEVDLDEGLALSAGAINAL
ncbi:peptidase U32 family protein, partial [Methanobrevibacter gottschalkii]|uniref:peptidase U32 family protein n=1 Tax=Methanobrevibacter gottschalkii TaxID=190974 RepID=UPI0038D2460F